MGEAYQQAVWVSLPEKHRRSEGEVPQSRLGRSSGQLPRERATLAGTGYDGHGGRGRSLLDGHDRAIQNHADDIDARGAKDVRG